MEKNREFEEPTKSERKREESDACNMSALSTPKVASRISTALIFMIALSKLRLKAEGAREELKGSWRQAAEKQWKGSAQDGNLPPKDSLEFARR